MYKAQELLERMDRCVQKALETNDVNLKMFYINAAKGCKIKFEKMTLSQAEELI